MLARLRKAKETLSNPDDVMTRMLITSQREYPLPNQSTQLARITGMLFSEAYQLFHAAEQTLLQDDYLNAFESYQLIKQFIEWLTHLNYASTTFLLLCARLRILQCEISLNVTFHTRAVEALRQIENDLTTASLDESQRNELSHLIQQIKSIKLEYDVSSAILTANYTKRVVDIYFFKISDPALLRIKPYLGVPHHLAEHEPFVMTLLTDLERAYHTYSLCDPRSSQSLLSLISAFDSLPYRYKGKAPSSAIADVDNEQQPSKKVRLSSDETSVEKASAGKTPVQTNGLFTQYYVFEKPWTDQSGYRKRF